VAHFTLTELQYSTDRKGPWQLYIYHPSGRGYEIRQYFAREVRYPDEEIGIAAAAELSNRAVANGKEVRVTDGGDFLVFHSQNGRILYGENFWKEIA
jgi:hypothetical protein